MNKSSQSSPVSVWALISRFLLAFIYLYLGLKHLFNTESFRRTIASPESGSNFLRDIFALPLENEVSFTVFRFFAVSIEILMGIMLIIGVLLRLLGYISSSLTFILAVSLIPNFFLFFLHFIPCILSLLLIFFNSNKFVPAERFIPESLLTLQKK